MCEVCRIVFRNAGFCRRHHSATSYDSHPVSNASNSISLPQLPVPVRLKEKNYKGDFVDFDDLMPEGLGPAGSEVFQYETAKSN